MQQGNAARSPDSQGVKNNMSKKHTAEYWREWRKSHREQYLANQRRRRRANMSPEKRAALLAAKKEWHRKQDPNYGVGRGHGRHYLFGFTADERAAHHAAQCAQWRIEHRERMREFNRKYYKAKRNDPAFKARLKESRKKWIDKNYQKYLSIVRKKSRRKNDKNRVKEYRPRMSMRVPEWVTCRAESRHLAKLAAIRRAEVTVSFATAIQSGLTVGRFAI